MRLPRLHGLSYIEEAISMTQRRKYQQWDDGMSYTGYTNPTYRAPQVARYVAQNNIAGLGTSTDLSNYSR